MFRVLGYGVWSLGFGVWGLRESSFHSLIRRGGSPGLWRNLLSGFSNLNKDGTVGIL